MTILSVVVGHRSLRIDPSQKNPAKSAGLSRGPKGEESNSVLLIENAESTIYRKLGFQRGQIQLKCDLGDTVASVDIRYGVRE
jgi:hypothetical protein